MSQIDELVNLGLDREALGLLPAGQVQLLHNKLVTNEEGDDNTAVPDPAPDPAQAPTLPSELTELADFIRAAGGAKAFAESLGAANQLATSQKQARSQRIAYLANLDSVPFTADELATMSDGMLAKLEGNTRTVNYAGLGFGITDPDLGDDMEPVGEYRSNAGIRIPKNGTGGK